MHIKTNLSERTEQKELSKEKDAEGLEEALMSLIHKLYHNTMDYKIITYFIEMLKYRKSTRINWNTASWAPTTDLKVFIDILNRG
jgi:hypothetical protein